MCLMLTNQGIGLERVKFQRILWQYVIEISDLYTSYLAGRDLQATLEFLGMQLPESTV